jgi:hypothetical protein
MPMHNHESAGILEKTAELLEIGGAADLDCMAPGIHLARRGRVEKGNVVNTSGLAGLRNRLRRREPGPPGPSSRTPEAPGPDRFVIDMSTLDETKR